MALRQRMIAVGVRQVMSAIGSSADNLLADSLNARIERETLRCRKTWSTEREARLDAFRWLTLATPDAVTSASDNASRSRTRQRPKQHQPP
ncbi:hypothetical protein ACFQ9Z_35910 [Streptomyces sp. NPDC056580]|uniref:hypothetical protein n=1 Tax=Streptomyces sp. NPDC056580 TaxID=3345872 RepID=UPI00369A981D